MSNKYCFKDANGGNNTGTIASADLSSALASPPAIGGTTPNTGLFTSITSTGSVGMPGGSYNPQGNPIPGFSFTANGTAANYGGALGVGLDNNYNFLLNTGGGFRVYEVNVPAMTLILNNGSLSLYNDITVGRTTYFGNAQTYKVDSSGNASLNSLNCSSIGGTTPGTGQFTKLSATQGRPTSPIATKTGNYTMATTDGDILVNANGGAVTIKLPASPLTNEEHAIKKTDSSTNVVTISGNGKTIDGATTQSLSTQYAVFWIKYDGTNWWIL